MTHGAKSLLIDNYYISVCFGVVVAGVLVRTAGRGCVIPAYFPTVVFTSLWDTFEIVESNFGTPLPTSAKYNSRPRQVLESRFFLNESSSLGDNAEKKLKVF